jgi:hypothetical protein
MGKFIGLDINHIANDKCGNCGMKTKAQKGCCDNKQLQAKISNDQRIVENSFPCQIFINAACPDYSFIAVFLPAASTKLTFNHGPPLITDSPAYLMYRNLRI